MNGQYERNHSSNKRRRLNHACDRCRSKKTRCDDRSPDCSNCYKAGVKCVTRDARNPSVIVMRHEAQSSPASHQSMEGISVQGNESTPRSMHSVGSSTRRRSLINDIEDAIQPPGQGRAIARLPVFPRFMNGNSLYILTQWLDLAFARLNHSTRFSHLYKEKNRNISQPALSERDVDQVLDDPEECQQVLENFLGTIHHVFRLNTVEYWQTILTRPRPDRPVHAILRALTLAMTDRPDAHEYLSLAFSSTNVIIQYSDMDSLLALFMMIISFRRFHDSHTAVHLLSVANSIARGLGIHTASSKCELVHIDLWWSFYAIDKALAVELERKPMISGDTCDQTDPVHSEVLTAIVQLARIQEKIVDRVVQEREMEDSRDRTLDEIITNKMRSAGELDEMLQQWERSLPNHLRISDNPCLDEDSFLGVVYLSLQYHQTYVSPISLDLRANPGSLFAMHRNALITNAKHIRGLADEAFAGQQYRLRLRNGSLICYSTAKSIITLTGHVLDQGRLSVLDTTYTLLLAAIGLAIYIYKHPSTSLVNSDLQVGNGPSLAQTVMLTVEQLLSTVIAFIEQRAATGMRATPDKDLSKLLRGLHADLQTRVSTRGKMRQTQTLTESQDQTTIQNSNSIPVNAATATETAVGGEFVPTKDPTSVPNNDYTDPANFDMSFFTDDANQWPDFLELLDLSSPMASFPRDPG